VHHTDCGMLFSNDDLRGKLEAGTGSDASDIDFLPFGDLEQSVRDDVAAIKASPFIDEDIPVRGFVYDVKSGRLTEIS
jgi:carbonic anhydrase